MVKGIIFALGACVIWGLIFVIPQFMTGFTPIEITLGRYFFYGLISSLVFFKKLSQESCRYSEHIWGKALKFSLASTLLYYIFLILALRYSSSTICALILGISPLTIAFYGNWKTREISFKHLIIPSILIVVGLVMVNIPHFETTSSPLFYCLGLFFTLFSLSSWTWYVVANSKFLKNHPQICSSDWATMIGVATMSWVLLLTVVLSLFCNTQFQIDKFLTHTPELERYIIGSSILGLLCSWVGAFLWNKATFYLPVSLAGQLTIFETIFGVIYLLILAGTLPSLLEGAGIVLMFLAILYAIRKFTRKKPYSNQITPD